LISIWRRGLTCLGLDRLSAATIEGVSAVTLATHNMACVAAFTACWDLRSFTVVMTRRLQAFGLDELSWLCTAPIVSVHPKYLFRCHLMLGTDMRQREFIRLFGGAAGLAACCTRSSQREAATDILGSLRVGPGSDSVASGPGYRRCLGTIVK
jgi:hypothetical protein